MAQSAKHAVYPELGAGGYSRIDATMEFYTRVPALTPERGLIVDFGAGRGVGAEDQVPARAKLRDLRRSGCRVVGADLDPAVCANPLVDESMVVRSEDPIPLADESVDLLVSDQTFEHIADPSRVSREFARVIKPNGWLCARTPYRWGSVGIATNLFPNTYHTLLLRYFQPMREERDVFSTTYSLNTFRQLRKHFPRSMWEDFSYRFSPEPGYLSRNRFALASGRLLDAVLPGSVLMVFLRRR
jgi:SAM-dependent methyltransferase